MRRSETDTRETVLQAAMNTFASHGFSGASIRDIAAAAGVTKPTVYYHFGSKADLYQALVDLAFDRMHALMSDAAESEGPARRRLERLLASVFAFTRAERDLVRIAFVTPYAAAEELPDNIACTSKHVRNVELLHTIMEQGQRSGELAPYSPRVLVSAVYGQMMNSIMGYLVGVQEPPDDALAEEVVRLFMDGAAATAH